ncbi:MAG: hypothetical protein SGI74_06310 [Oligoflexia bacterium]|nr:hypothetical protein [Oligoflexia bacterium]
MKNNLKSEMLKLAPLPVARTSLPRTALGRWLHPQEHAIEGSEHAETKPWHQVLWLTGVDYFSTLGYQPGLALLAAGILSPIATLILIAVTLLCALPTYSQVARRSFAGQGSIAMLENLLNGWRSKIFVLVLLGFAATDFIITITLSSADAALHLAENPFLHEILGNSQLSITMVLITLLAIVFLKGFSEAIGLARLIAVPYILLNFLVLFAGVWEIIQHPEVFANWTNAVSARGDWSQLILVSVLVFPKLALGMSGFETGVSVMPLVAGSDKTGRIKNTQKLLVAAALLMSVLLLLSSIVTTLLIPNQAYETGGAANGRALAFLAHQLLGSTIGSVYDASTILVLWFAGASAMAGMLNLIPRYLPRFGMAPLWVAHRRPLVLVLFAVAVGVTWLFDADVEAQGSAYATGVLALMLSAAVAVSLAFWREAKDAVNKKREMKLWSFYFAAVALVFAFTFLDNVILKPEGLMIAGGFILAILIFGAFSRSQRAFEPRVDKITLENEATAEIWSRIINKKVHLVPLADTTPELRAKKALELRKYYRFEGPIAFVHVVLSDNRSEFLSELKINVTEESTGDVMIEVSGAIAIANTIAYVSELLNPISVYIGLTRMNLMNQAFRYLVWGEGETGLLVYRILLRYWEWTPEDDVRPLIFLMSE